jgi:prenylcysteine oxidase/farnesylcysteine lyase
VEPPEPALRARPFQVTWATFVKGTPRAAYFGLARASDLPDTVLTVEDDTIPFSSMGLVATSPDGAPIYKLFSREPVAESLLDELFSCRDAVEQIRWEAYPVLRPDGALPPVRLADGLYWVNAMEFAVSTMETEAVAARNVANLVAAQLAS